MRKTLKVIINSKRHLQFLINKFHHHHHHHQQDRI
ncbi:hypothetical protein BLA29_014849 [Euroglyphus maynei]|uniref:Uncharacterized protein n=1 Tax=Euroglyphus maynei TaxID=6958 RepID=A0A1Y3BI20_EURMA|nr:hypothetical protein BLA29_014849 [Euroglyphus maynei]